MTEAHELRSATVFQTEEFSRRFGTIRVEVWPDGLAFWADGEIRWQCDNQGRPAERFSEEWITLRTQEAYAAGQKQGREEAMASMAESDVAQLARLSGRAEGQKMAREFPVYSADVTGMDSDFREVGEPMLAVRMTPLQAEQLDDALSDLLCWIRGFNAALGADDLDRRPMGAEAARTIRETIHKAQRAAEKANTK